MTFWFNTENSVTNLNYTFLTHIAIMTLAGLVGICVSRTIANQYTRYQMQSKKKKDNALGKNPVRKLFHITDDYLSLI